MSSLLLSFSALNSGCGSGPDGLSPQVRSGSMVFAPQGSEQLPALRCFLGSAAAAAAVALQVNRSSASLYFRSARPVCELQATNGGKLST